MFCIPWYTHPVLKNYIFYKEQIMLFRVMDLIVTLEANKAKVTPFYAIGILKIRTIHKKLLASIMF